MRFDVYRIPPGGAAGFLVDVQADYLDALPSRMVVPLLPEGAFTQTFHGLNPRLEVLGETYILMTQELASIQQRHLHRAVASLAGSQDEIARALDMLLTGF